MHSYPSCALHQTVGMHLYTLCPFKLGFKSKVPSSMSLNFKKTSFAFLAPQDLGMIMNPMLWTLFSLCSLNPGHHTTVSLAKLLPQKAPRGSSFPVVTCATQLFLWVCILQFPLISYQTEGTLHINVSRIHHSFIIYTLLRLSPNLCFVF